MYINVPRKIILNKKYVIVLKNVCHSPSTQYGILKSFAAMAIFEEALAK